MLAEPVKAKKEDESMLSFLEKGFTLYIMAAICIAGVIGKLVINHIYKKLIRQSDNLTTAEDRQLRQLKTKYETTYRMNVGVHNINAFVENNIDRYKKGIFHIRKLENVALNCGLFVFVMGLCAALLSFLYEAETKAIVMNSSIGFILAVSMVLVDNIVDTRTKRESLVSHLCNYLTNVLVVRTSQELAEERSEGKTMGKRAINDDIFMKKGREKRILRGNTREKGEIDQTEALKKSLAQIAASKEGENGREKKLTPKEERLIEDIIKEYLT